MGDGTEHWFEKPIEIYLDSGNGNVEKKFITVKKAEDLIPLQQEERKE